MRTTWIVATVLIVLLAVLHTAGGLDFWQRYWLDTSGAPPDVRARALQPRLTLTGAPENLPRATAEAELIDAAALTAAADAARRVRARALIVDRHGHRVFEYFRTGTNGTTPVTGGELVPALAAAATGILVETGRLAPAEALKDVGGLSRAFEQPGWRNPWSRAARRRFALAPAPDFLLKDADGTLAHTLSQRVWQPLHAQDASLWGRDDRALRLDCCAAAQLDDWMRVGNLLLQQGSFEGERIASPDWMRRLLAGGTAEHPRAIWLAEQRPWSGDEPPAAQGVLWFDLGAGLRLWLAPSRGLAVLLWTESRAATDTEIPNILLRGLIDQAPPASSGSALDQMVPEHGQVK